MRDAGADERAPAWAVPLLSAILVVTAEPHALRRLDEAAFRRVDRGCTIFILATTLPGLLAAFVLLPDSLGMDLLVVFCVWGQLLAMALNRVAMERLRRRRLRRGGGGRAQGD